MADFEVIFMDAGQGDCTLIVYPDNSLTLVDCGSTKSGKEAFAEIEKVLERYLDYKYPKIETLVLTHPDVDHYNKLLALTTRRSTDMTRLFDYVYYGGDIRLYKNPAFGLLGMWAKLRKAGPPDNSFSFTPDERLSRAGVNVTILAANASGDPKDENLKNINSIVLMVEYGPVKLFLMGDAFFETERRILDFLNKFNRTDILQKAPAQEIVLKMGHHGSDTSTGSQWVSTIEPNILVISSGTKRFSGKGMPTKGHLKETDEDSSLITTGIKQTYVAFDERKRGVKGEDFVTMPATDRGIWTTCYEVEWSDSRWKESGQTWYYGVTPSRGKKPPQIWHGYTGYEEEQDVADDT